MLQKDANQDSKEAITIVNRGLAEVNNTMVPIVNLNMKPGPDTDANMLNFTWTCVDFLPNHMDI